MDGTNEEIAIVGIGCNFPGGEGLDSFWKVMLEGRNCAVDIPEERFDSTYWYDPDHSKPGKTQTTKAALIDGFNEFDHKFFGISEAEANFMDPQHKLLLQCTYRAIEDAGIPMEKISGTRTGVYIGLMNRDYETLLNNSPDTITHYNGTGTAMSVAANRISFVFNLTGPSFAIDSACSSSLVALHSACQAIKQGDCEMALCGGVSCILEARVFVALSKAKMISPDGTSKPFSSSADGYGRGEGCGIVLLKPLKNALRDFDKVWGIVSKTAVNQDGRSVTPITKPSMVQQEALLRTIYSASDLATVQYIEAHGTGTPVGDLTEAGSISKVIATARPPGSDTLRIGSVKGNIGHTESAAGVAGLIKVLLMMKHETIVPSVFYSEDSASIDARDLNIHIPTTAEKWEVTGTDRLAGVNSFGFGGTNAHAVVKEYRQVTVPRLTTHSCRNVFVLSAASEKSLLMCIKDTCQRLTRNKTSDIQALAFSSACRRSLSKHKYRKAFLTHSVSDLENQLKSFNNKVEQSKSDMRLVFVFCGNGVTYRGMCKQLLKEEPVFREKVREIENLFLNYKSTRIVQKIAEGLDNDDYTKPEVVQPLLFSVQVGIASLLKHWGIQADAVLGHSVGEVAAAHCSGLLSLEDAVKVIYHRSVLQGMVTGGKMLVVSNIPLSDILNVLPVYSGKICVAAYNSPQSCTLSGDPDAISSLRQKLETLFKGKNLFLHVLDVPAAYHSQMMEPIVDQVKDSIGCLTANKMQCELFSTVTGEMCSDGDFTTGRYWAQNIRQPVYFEQTLRAATKDHQTKKSIVFVEIGPRRALQRNIQETLGNNINVFSSAQPEKDHETILATVSKLFELGREIDWDQFYAGCETTPTSCPRYQFDTQRNEVHFEAVRQGNEMAAPSNHPLISKTKHDKKEYKCIISTHTMPYLWEHKNNGVSIVPGALYVELAYASIMASSRPKIPISSIELSVTFQSLFTLCTNSHQMKVILEHTGNDTMFKILSSTATHASGTMTIRNGQTLIEEQTICLGAIFGRCPSVKRGDEVYSILNYAGFEYGPVFRQLDEVYFGEEFKEAVSVVRVPGELLKQLHEYFLHPVVLDYFLQMTAVVANGGLHVRPGLPSGIGSVVISGPLQEEMVLYLRATEIRSDCIDVCGCFSSKEGHVLVELKQVRIFFLGVCSDVAESLFFHTELHHHPPTSVGNDFLLRHRPKAFVFEDTLGVTKALRPFLNPDSTYVPNRELWVCSQLPDLVSQSLHGDCCFEEVLFVWGIEDLSHLTIEKTLDSLVDCCEHFRQIVVALKDLKRSCNIRVITYRSSEKTVDHVSSGFVMSGMTRACAAEISELSFQLVDLASVTCEDIQALVQVIHTCKDPEVTIDRGQISSTAIVRTPLTGIACPEQRVRCWNFEQFALQSRDPYRVDNISAVTCDKKVALLQDDSVEIQLLRVCVHSSDYCPVTVSDMNFGQTLYWNKHSSQTHNVVALDFSGVVTAIGKGVRKLKVGDHVASCYPVTATSKVEVPEAACYDTKMLPLLRDIPCLSYFVLAWEIMHRLLPKVKKPRTLALVSSAPNSALMTVLIQTANRSGWKIILLSEFSEELLNSDRDYTFVALPPVDLSPVVRTGIGSMVKQVVVVCNRHMSTTANIGAPDSEHVHIQICHVSSVFQRANLKTQKVKISKWLQSLHLDSLSMSLQSTSFQSTGERVAQTTTEAESYFSTHTIPQVILGRSEVSENTECNIPLIKRPKSLFKHSCVYIVTGGLSGLGFETVKFIAHRGGDCIVTLSRRPPSAETQGEINTLQKTSKVSILNIQCDVSVPCQVVKAVTRIGQQFPSCPIKGVFHSAAVLQDAQIESLDRSSFRNVLCPKVSGALNLHHVTLHNKLDFFVCYSSISSFIGNASQSNYAAANAFLDTFCHYRRNLGLAGQSINWGPLNLGLLLNKKHFQRFLEAKGMMTMDVCEAHVALEKCLRLNNPQQAICKFHFRNLSKHVLSQNTSLKTRLFGLVERELQNNTAMTETRVQQLSSTPECVRTLISEISNVSVEELEDDATLGELGIDSMLAMTLQNHIFQVTGVNIPLVHLLDPNSTLATLDTILREAK